jgi:hypothetical protein
LRFLVAAGVHAEELQPLSVEPWGSPPVPLPWFSSRAAPVRSFDPDVTTADAPGGKAADGGAVNLAKEEQQVGLALLKRVKTGRAWSLGNAVAMLAAVMSISKKTMPNQSGIRTRSRRRISLMCSSG